MPVSQANRIVCDDLVIAQGSSDFLEKLSCRAWSWNRRKREVSGSGLERKIDPDNFAKPWQQIWKPFTAQAWISIAGHRDRAGVIDREGGVLESPGLCADGIARIVLRGAGMDPAFHSDLTHHDFARIDDRAELDDGLSVITRSGGAIPTRVDVRT